MRASTKGYEIFTDYRGHRLRLYTPTEPEVRRHAAQLADFYNDPHNSSMMDHSTDHTAADIFDLYTESSPDTLRFFIEADGAFLGDADLRHVDYDHRTAEYAVMIGARAAQGKGWGTQVSLMVTYFAFAELGLQTVYLTIIPANRAGQRAYEKVGYQPDDTPAAQAYKDHPEDIAMSITRDAFQARHGERLPIIHIRSRK